MMLCNLLLDPISFLFGSCVKSNLLPLMLFHVKCAVFHLYMTQTFYNFSIHCSCNLDFHSSFSSGFVSSGDSPLAPQGQNQSWKKSESWTGPNYGAQQAVVLCCCTVFQIFCLKPVCLFCDLWRHLRVVWAAWEWVENRYTVGHLFSTLTSAWPASSQIKTFFFAVSET